MLKEKLMDTAVNMEGNVSIQADGTWNFTWGRTYVGNKYLSDVHNEPANLYSIKRISNSLKPFMRKDATI
jgi:hypothetical protein